MSLSLNNNLEPPKKLPIVILSQGKKPYELQIFPWMTIAELKKRIEGKFGMPVVNQRLFLRTQELTRNNAMLLSYGIRKWSRISIRTPLNIQKLGLIVQYENFPEDDRIKNLIFMCQRGFNDGLVPKPTLEGTSGVYFIRDSNRKNIGIFKPVDEEPFAPNNPKGYQGKLGSQGFRRGVLSGEAGAREVAASLLDDKGFFDVPPTTFVELAHPYFGNRELNEEDIEDSYKELAPTLSANMNSMIVKTGSIQKFIDNAEEASDYGHSCFSEEEVHKIAILDILILNCDRNEGNILIKKESNKRFRLIPIDHGLSFPDTIDICTYELVWTEWPQIHKPFSEREMEFIDTLDPKEDTLRLASFIRFRDICLRNFRIASTVLIKCAKAGLTISEIAGILYKEDPDMVAPIEDLIKRTEAITETMKNSISRDFLKMLAHKNNKSKMSKMTKHFPQNIIMEEKKEKEIYDKSKPNGAIKSFNKSTILPDINEETEENSGMRNSLKVTKTTSLTDKKDSRKQSMEVDVSMEFGSEDSSFDHEDDLSSPGRLGLKQPGLVRKASMPDLTAIEEEKENPEKTEDEVNEEKKKLQYKGSKKKNKPSVPAYLDDLFFYYFNEFLNQKIEAIVKEKFKSQGRWRFRSTNS